MHKPYYVQYTTFFRDACAARSTRKAINGTTEKIKRRGHGSALACYIRIIWWPDEASRSYISTPEGNLSNIVAGARRKLNLSLALCREGDYLFCLGL